MGIYDDSLVEDLKSMTAAVNKAGGRIVAQLAHAGHFALGQDIEVVPLLPSDLVVSVHACGSLTDRVLERAISANARVAVLPCCHDLDRCDTRNLEGWMDGPLAVDATRASRLSGAGYQVFTQVLPASITPKNRLLMRQPTDG